MVVIARKPAQPDDLFASFGAIISALIFNPLLLTRAARHFANVTNGRKRENRMPDKVPGCVLQNFRPAPA
jgi:hypothetical protein